MRHLGDRPEVKMVSGVSGAYPRRLVQKVPCIRFGLDSRITYLNVYLFEQSKQCKYYNYVIRHSGDKPEVELVSAVVTD